MKTDKTSRLENVLIAIILMLIISGFLSSCTPEEIQPDCNVRIGVLDNFTNEYVPVSFENYQMLYDLYLELDNGCHDAVIDFGNHTIIYTAI